MAAVRCASSVCVLSTDLVDKVKGPFWSARPLWFAHVLFTVQVVLLCLSSIQIATVFPATSACCIFSFNTCGLFACVRVGSLTLECSDHES